MSTIIGQLSHFDISTPNFDPIGSSYTVPNGTKIIIPYGSSDGEKRKRLALRRYVYYYIFNNFDFVGSYKGVRNRTTLPSNVGDTDDLNTRFALYGSLVSSETAPSYITQDLLNTLFLYPNSTDFFFIDGSHSCRMGPPSIYGPKPNFFEIYRYGKLSKTDSTQVLSFKNNLISSRSKI